MINVSKDGNFLFDSIQGKIRLTMSQGKIFNVDYLASVAFTRGDINRELDGGKRPGSQNLVIEKEEPAINQRG
jgi:hypothetical protein